MQATWSKNFSVLQWFGIHRTLQLYPNNNNNEKYCQVWWSGASWQRREAKAIMGWLSSWVPAGAWTLRPTQANQILTHHHCCPHHHHVCHHQCCHHHCCHHLHICYRHNQMSNGFDQRAENIFFRCLTILWQFAWQQLRRLLGVIASPLSQVGSCRTFDRFDHYEELWQGSL